VLLGAAALPLAAWRARRGGDARLLGFLLCVGVGVLANAAVTGALSGPHDRYGARIAWLLPLSALLAWWPRRGVAAGRGEAGPLHAETAAP
jgi:peptidoglycan/LPS O-acetylase OafA/YrhL